MPYPQTISNGGGERLTFIARREDDRGEYLEVRNSVDPGAGPPMHVHHLQEEALTVESGTLAYQRLGEPEQRAAVGETVIFPPGEAHRFWNAGADELVCSGTVRPPDSFEYYLRKLFASMRRNGGKRPSLFDVAWLSRRYASEFGTLIVPKPVQRLLFPVIVAAGTLRGKHERFHDAPQPVAAAGPAEG